MSTLPTDTVTTPSRQLTWPPVAARVGLLLAAGCALEVLVDAVTTLTTEGPLELRVLFLGGGLFATAVVLLVASVLVVLSATLGGEDARRTTVATVIIGTAVVITLIEVAAFLVSFDDAGGQGFGLGSAWPTRLHLLMGGVAAVSAAALANTARD